MFSCSSGSVSTCCSTVAVNKGVTCFTYRQQDTQKPMLGHGACNDAARQCTCAIQYGGTYQMLICMVLELPCIAELCINMKHGNKISMSASLTSAVTSFGDPASGFLCRLRPTLAL